MSSVASARIFRYAGIATLAFMIGSASVVLAAGSGAMQLPSFRIADGTNPDQFAKVDASGNVQVSVNNMPSSQQVTGTVSVSNFPATQPVSGTVAVSSLPGGRVILLASNVTAISHNGVTTPTVDTSDCRSLVAMVRGQFSASDIKLELVQSNPDGSGFGIVGGTRAGIMTYFTVGGVNVVSPRAGVSYQSNTDGDLAIDNVWLFCGR